MGDPEYTIVQIVHLDETGDSYHRMRWPAATLARQEPSWRVLNINWTAEERYDLALHADLLVLFQCADPYLLDILRKRKANGLETLVEYNDNFYSPAPASPVAPHWSSPVLWQMYETFLQEASGVIVTGKGLQDLFGDKTEKPIHILQNEFHHSMKPFEALWEAKGEKLRFGWAGSLGHFADVYRTREVILELLKEYPEATFSFMGNSDFFRELRLPKFRTEVHDWGSMQQYLRFWESVHIGFTPLLDHPYNHCRSDVKALEIGASGAVPVLSKVGPYAEFLGKCKLANFKDENELHKVLSQYLSDPAKAKRAAKKAHSWIEKNRLGIKCTGRGTLYGEYLKKSPSRLNLPLQAGYYELYGTREERTKNERIIAQARQLEKKRASEQAIKLYLKNRFDHDLCLRGITLWGKQDKVAACRFLEQIIPDQRLDLRFLLLFTRLTTSDDARWSAWTRLLKQLTELGEVSIRYYSEMVVEEFLSQLRSKRRIAKLAPKLLELYPNSAELLFINAREKALEGDLESSSESAERAVQVIDDLKLNRDSTVPREMAASWALASSKDH